MNHLELNETHDINLTSWVESANEKGCDYPIQNLPFAEFRRKNSNEAFRCGVAIGNKVLDLTAVLESHVFPVELNRALEACSEPTLNRFMGMGAETWSLLRLNLSRGLAMDSDLQGSLKGYLIDMQSVEYSLPCQIGDYTDFYTSLHHATNVGKLFRPDNPLLPNYKWIPIGYHGRSSSIKVSGHPVHRPVGQLKPPSQETPTLEPCKRLDYELEVGIYIGSGNEMGSSIALDEADQHVFGYCLFNDWSARDIQAWEYVPLGPFLGKSFASTISPWIVTSEALIPYRQSWSRDETDPQPLDYLESKQNREQGAVDIKLQVALQTQSMQQQGVEPVILSKSTFAYSYWTVAQMVTHHSVNGCNLQPGDFFGSGTQSGPGVEELGSLLELSEGGKKSIDLPGGESRTFLQDGDTVIMTGYCEKEGTARIGFGEAVGVVVP
ncbi:MAG: fumarylacetoacetase [Gammaproteobacteria bacterium]|nr:fumarylacetoacetase [Gammaproteobacteria bacterium]